MKPFLIHNLGLKIFSVLLAGMIWWMIHEHTVREGTTSVKTGIIQTFPQK